MSEHQNSEVITKEKIDKAINLLKEQKPKEREDVSDREAIRKMRRYIEKLTSNKYGYSYEEVSEMLKGLGINLTGSRIKYLIGELKKSSRRRDQASDNGDSSISVQGATENQQAVVESSEAEEAPVKSTLGKSKKQQPATQEPEAKSEPTREPNRSAFVPKIYKDDEI
ncbi:MULTISPECIES: hypothetical protein [Nostoc]|uniref:Mobilization protein MobC n=2 Tax=Nostoc TaxID=1177 RepID=A0ABR8IHU5_9NOSO|nr:MULTISPECIES: hypothetical protein [Nostoc]MBD2565495.1 hypothetical protein [Nostoc linckia FACHB-391]MBD2650744.1 hypothetical protein [Nostoc foliaceum FACHB-393]